jgi:polar amino acid transport system permease protein
MNEADNQEPIREDTPLDEQHRQRGRIGLTIPWEHIPWWGIIILIVGVIVGYSMLTNVRYIDAMRFILDFPWNRNAVARTTVDEDQRWTLNVRTPLRPNTYTLYAEYYDEMGDPIGRSDTFQVVIPDGAPEEEIDPITLPIDRPIELNTTLPSFSGQATSRVENVILIHDFSNRPLLIARRIWSANGVFLTIRVTLTAFSGALILGLIFGLMRVASRSPDLLEKAPTRLLLGLGLIAVTLFANPSWRDLKSGLLIGLLIEVVMFLLPALPYTLSTLYVEVIRGVPMLVIVLYMGFAITPVVRDASENWFTGQIDLRGLPAAIIALAFGYGAYLAEIYRAGIESIPRGQMEAARSLGMSYFHAMRYVILPQAIRVVLPPLGNDFIAMLKDSSLISVIALPEILQQGRLWISRNFRAFEGYNTVAMLYLVMTLLLSLLVRYIERRARIE